MDRLTLECRQIWVYLIAILGGLAMGSVTPEVGPHFELLLWPTLAVLLYTTFVQVPLLHVRDAFRDRRFVGAAERCGRYVEIRFETESIFLYWPSDSFQGTADGRIPVSPFLVSCQGVSP